jgi:hypothetical protein
MQVIMRTFLLPTLWLLFAGPAAAGSDEPLAPGSGPLSLAELARKADFVALAQVRDTDYLRSRDIPVSGSAYLRVLVPYKGDAGIELVEVYEKGLHERECYFPDRDVFEEGRRYLLFLQHDADHPERYRGLAEGCAVDVLVDRDNRYAIRLPVTGLTLSDPLEQLARTMQFSDPYAVVDDASLPPALRDAMLAAGQIVAHESEAASSSPGPAGLPRPDAAASRLWRYTQGVSLGEFRELMRLEPADRQTR